MLDETGPRFWFNSEHDCVAGIMFSLSWNDTNDDYNTVSAIESMFVRGKNKNQIFGADLWPVTNNNSSDTGTSENPDFLNDVSKIPWTSGYFIFCFFWTFALTTLVFTFRSNKCINVHEDQSRNGYFSGIIKTAAKRFKNHKYLISVNIFGVQQGLHAVIYYQGQYR